jgi:uncharacterized protein
MVLVARQLPAELFRPRSLMMLMGLYERNYERLVRLFGDPARLPRSRRLKLPGRPPLYLTVVSRSRYTVELTLTHLFAQERLPDLRIRLYRDARLAEALPLRDSGPSRGPLSRLEPRWEANLLLYKWLDYCLDATGAGESSLEAA